MTSPMACKVDDCTCRVTTVLQWLPHTWALAYHDGCEWVADRTVYKDPYPHPDTLASYLRMARQLPLLIFQDEHSVSQFIADESEELKGFIEIYRMAQAHTSNILVTVEELHRLVGRNAKLTAHEHGWWGYEAMAAQLHFDGELPLSANFNLLRPEIHSQFALTVGELESHRWQQSKIFQYAGDLVNAALGKPTDLEFERTVLTEDYYEHLMARRGEAFLAVMDDGPALLVHRSNALRKIPPHLQLQCTIFPIEPVYPCDVPQSRPVLSGVAPFDVLAAGA